MTKVTITVDDDNDMMKIHVGKKVVFVGNIWDFNRPDDIRDLLLEIPGVQVESKEGRIRC